MRLFKKERYENPPQKSINGLKKKVKVNYNGSMSNQNYKEVFEEAINQIHAEMNAQGMEDDFQLWFNISYIDDTFSEINVSVQSEFMWKQMVSKNYVDKIENKIHELIGQTIQLKHTTAVKPFEPPKPVVQEKNYAEEKKIKADIPEKTSFRKHPQLNSNFTFENFIPGDNSIYAYNASLKAAENPGKIFNPILIYGGVGLGKTHLMQALGNHIYNSEKGEKLKIVYLSAENFMNEFTSSLRLKNDAIDSFKKKYRNCDVLLLDDIQFLEGKEATQEELFHTFNSIYDKNGQIVFTSDRPIKEIKGFTERLSSRFSRGLNVDLQPPSYENRIAIIQKKLEIMGVEIPEDVIDYIAKNCQTNVRDIESCIIKLTGYAELVKKTLTVEIAQNQLRDTINDPYSGTITIDSIIKVIADHYNVSVSDIKGKKKDKKYVIPRQLSMYICCKITEFSLTEIGTEHGRDHTTVMHARDKVESMIKTDSSLNSTVNLLIRDIKDYKK